MKRTQKKVVLETIAGFQGLPEEDLQKLMNLGTFKEYERGEEVFYEGQKGDGFYVVQKGSVKIFKLSPEGKEIILHICGVGDHLGNVAVCQGNPFPAHARCLARSILLFFPRQGFVDLFAREPNIALQMIGVLSNRLMEFMKQVENLGLKEVPGRLASYLLHLWEDQGEGESVQLAISKGELAKVLGTTPETLSRVLKDMASRNLLDLRKKEVILEDMEELQRLRDEGHF